MSITLSRLPEGTRFRVPELNDQTGTLLKINECRALVRYDKPPQFVHYDTADGRHVEFYRQAEPMSVSPYLEVVPLA